MLQRIYAEIEKPCIYKRDVVLDTETYRSQMTSVIVYQNGIIGTPGKVAVANLRGLLVCHQYCFKVVDINYNLFRGAKVIYILYIYNDINIYLSQYVYNCTTQAG